MAVTIVAAAPWVVGFGQAMLPADPIEVVHAKLRSGA